MSAVLPSMSRTAGEPNASETRVLLAVWIASLVLLLGGLAVWIAIGEHEHAGRVWAQVLGLATLPGKYVIFSGLSEESPLRPWPLALLAVGADLAIGATLAVGLGPLGRLPWIGPMLKTMHDRAEQVLVEYPRLRRMAFFGVVLFVYLPLPASGAIGGTFVGQLLGLSRLRGLCAVVLGGGLVSATFAALAIAMGSQAQTMLENPWVTVSAVLVFAVVVFFAYRAARNALRR